MEAVLCKELERCVVLVFRGVKSEDDVIRAWRYDVWGTGGEMRTVHRWEGSAYSSLTVESIS
jgi:hypothetical protein